MKTRKPAKLVRISPLVDARVRYLGTLTNKTVVYPGIVVVEDGRREAYGHGLTHYDFSIYDVHGQPITTRLVDGRPTLPVKHPGHIGHFMAEREEGRPMFQILMPFEDKIRLAAKLKPPEPTITLSRTRRGDVRLTVEYILRRNQTGYEQSAWILLGLGKTISHLIAYFRSGRLWRA